MDDSRAPRVASPRLRALARQGLGWFASTKLAVMLLVSLAAVLATATVLEAAKGREWAQWYVYKSPWFMAVVGLLAVNILAATIVRFPWRRDQRGFLLAHAGVLVLLAGAFLSFVAGIEGQLGLEEGQSGDALVMADHNQLAMVWARRDQPLRSLLTFEPGPTDWPEHTTLRLDAVDGVKIEILKYYRHARTEEQWIADSSSAGRPVVQVALTTVDGTPMVQQWLTADPHADEVFLGPVRLTFQRAPAALPEAGTQFLQTPDGNLHYRVILDGKIRSHGEATVGSRIRATDQLGLLVVKYLPHARQNIAFFPVGAADNDSTAPEPAALVKVEAGGETHELWLKRADPDYGYQEISTPEGPLAIAFGYETLPLGFSLKLVHFRHEMNPGMMGDASFASSVRVIDKAHNVDRPAEIAMNQPLVYGGFTFYQSSYAESADGKPTSVLTVAYDPGRFLKYLGCLMTCFGVFAVFYGRSLSLFIAALAGRRRTNASASTVAIAVFALATLAVGSGPALAGEGRVAAFDWRPWRSLPVQDGGRRKPLDTLARETFRTIERQVEFLRPADATEA